MPHTKKELSTLYKIIQLLGSGDNIREMLEGILKLLSTETGMERGMISIVEKDFGHFYLDIAPDIQEREIRKIRYEAGEGITGRVLETGRPMAIPNLENEPLFLDRTGVRKELNRSNLAFICVPIKYGSRVIGALSVDTPNKEIVSLDEEVLFLEAVAHLIAQHVHLHLMQNEENRLERENIALRSKVESNWRPPEIMGNSRAMREIYSLVEQVADSNTTVIITGETGTGKELAARAIHQSSPRAGGPLVLVNCAMLPENLIENELFGHEKGAFTGASGRHTGRFERAHGGTIFLDEIGDIPPSAQVTLLRILQEKEFERIGGTEPIKVNVRIIAATNKNLEDAVAEGTFRQDLFYRLNVFPIHLPPLRERGADVLLLADYFVQKYARELNKNIIRISTPAIDTLMAYHWPGNVRELENCIERAVLLSTDGVIHVHNLPPSLQMETRDIRELKGGSLEKMVASYEKELIVEALKQSRGNQSDAARRLKTTKRVIQYKVIKYKIDCTKLKGTS